MIVQFSRTDLPIAYSMIVAADNLDERQEYYHPFQKYFYYWAAFNNIYMTIAFTGNQSPKLNTNLDGSIKKKQNGSVSIPSVIPVSEKEQIKLAIAEFDDDLRDFLVSHRSIDFFANRTPKWNNQEIRIDGSGQRLNGVLNVNFTIDSRNPVWSPVDVQKLTQYRANPNDKASRDFLVKQIIEILYTIRCNLVHGHKRIDDANSVDVVINALPLLRQIVNAFTKD